MDIRWVAFVPAALLVSLVPGANQLLSLRNAVRQGAVDASVALLGRFGAFVVLVALVACGLGTLLTRSAIALDVVRWAGVAYLSWLGVVSLVTAGQGGATTGTTLRSRPALVRQEFLVALTNPKALLLFAAFLPQFVTDTPGPAQLAVLGGAYIVIEAVSALGYTILGGRLRTGSLSGRAQRRVDATCGISFLGLAGALALDRV